MQRMRDKKTWHINNLCSWNSTISTLRIDRECWYTVLVLFVCTADPTFATQWWMKHDGKMVKIKVKIARLSACCQLSHSPFSPCVQCGFGRVAEAETRRQLDNTRFLNARHGSVKPIASLRLKTLFYPFQFSIAIFIPRRLPDPFSSYYKYDDFFYFQFYERGMLFLDFEP